MPKPGKPVTEIGSYRPVALTSILRRTLGRIVLKRVLAGPWRPSQHQFGLRPGPSTEDALAYLAMCLADAANASPWGAPRGSFRREETCLPTRTIMLRSGRKALMHFVFVFLFLCIKVGPGGWEKKGWVLLSSQHPLTGKNKESQKVYACISSET